MKKLLFLCLLLASASVSVAGQTAWERIALADPQAKISVTPQAPRFSIRLTGTFSLGRPAMQNIDFQTLQSAFITPGTVEQLFGQLGGPFFIGQWPGQPATQEVRLNGRFQPQPGLALGFPLTPRFALRASIRRYKANWSSVFPVVVMSNPQHTEPASRLLNGTLDVSASGMLLDAGAAFCLPGHALQPFVEGGVRGMIPGRSERSAVLAGVHVPLKTDPTAIEISPFGGAGLRLILGKNIFVETACSLGKIVQKRYTPTLEARLGMTL